VDEAFAARHPETVDDEQFENIVPGHVADLAGQRGAAAGPCRRSG
jgi:hypothetical protein